MNTVHQLFAAVKALLYVLFVFIPVEFDSSKYTVIFFPCKII